jgi:hypothetical protein
MAELKTIVAVAPQGATLPADQKLTKADDDTKAKAGPLDTFPNPSGRTILVLAGGAAAATVYLHALGKPGGLDIEPKAITLAANAYVVVGPFDPTIYNNASNAVGLSATTDDVKAFLIQMV